MAHYGKDCVLVEWISGTNLMSTMRSFEAFFELGFGQFINKHQLAVQCFCKVSVGSDMSMGR